MNKKIERNIIRSEDPKDILKKLDIRIDILLKDLEDYKNRYFELRNELYKDEEIKKLKEELDHYKYNNLMILSDKQKEQVKEFNRQHYNKCHCNSAQYVLTPTSIGIGVDIQCPICGEKLDITDYDLW